MRLFGFTRYIYTYLPNYIKPNESTHGVDIYTSPPYLAFIVHISTYIQFATFGGVGSFYLFSLLE